MTNKNNQHNDSWDPITDEDRVYLNNFAYDESLPPEFWQVADWVHELDARCTIAEKELAEIKDLMEKARTYTGFEGYPCPLCTYENGVFIKSCEMHTQIERLKYELDKATNSNKKDTNEK